MFATNWGRHQADIYGEYHDDGFRLTATTKSWSGIAVLVAFVASLAMLTATVFVGLYKKGYLCRGGEYRGGGVGKWEEAFKQQSSDDLKPAEEVSNRLEL